MAKGESEGLTTATAVVRMLLRRYVLGTLAVACFVGGGYLASGYLHPEQAAPPAHVDQSKVWNDLQRRADQLRRDLQGPAAPTPTPTHDNTERSI